MSDFNAASGTLRAASAQRFENISAGSMQRLSARKISNFEQELIMYCYPWKDHAYKCIKYFFNRPARIKVYLV